MARNPAAPVVILLRLLDTEIPDVQSALCGRVNMPDALFEAILSHADPNLRKGLAFNLSLGPERRSRLAADPDRRVRGNLVEQCGWGIRRPAGWLPMTVEAYERLAADPDVVIREEVALQRYTPDHVRVLLAGDPDPRVRGCLSDQWDLLPEEVREMLLNDPDDGVREEAREAAGGVVPLKAVGEVSGKEMRDGVLPRALAESLVRDGDMRRRAAVAGNPNLPTDLVDELAADPDGHVRLTVSTRPELSERERAEIDYHSDPYARFSPLPWVQALCDDAAATRKCAESAHPALRRSAAFCPHLPPDLVARLADDEDRLVRLFLAENHPGPPGSLLLRTVLEFASFAVDDMPRHPNFPRDAMRYFARSADERLRGFVIFDPEIPAEVIERLSHDPDRGVRARMAGDPRLPLDRLLVLLDEPGTASAAAANPALPVEVMERIIDG
ncbi:LRV domain-containing protein [Actinomadura sp. WMMB 499]|uniref:LRV domain-containing protein n=1 Tax=Actinomadura sp. WMMB 499 TaxID=1219491 RepID=UPI001247002C|nr:LRV domain-containing protein [Actinomadura sp. WMMB 499]QFG25061.1 LRV domain-containing protein [Actinomadura sp. WMMB 499]